MISYVIPAHDEAVLIGGTLDALRAAADALGRPYEVIVVDDASTDATAAIARERGATVMPVQHRHIAATRNAGARAARGDVLVFVDADTRVSPGLLQAAFDALDQGAVGGGATVTLRGRVAWHERIGTALVARGLRWARIAPGCFLFCTRAAFDAAGGFDERYYAAEDVAISRALSRVGRFVVLRHPVHTSDRKLRTFGLLDHLALFVRFALRGRGLLHSRDGLSLWYERRRHEPDEPA